MVNDILFKNKLPLLSRALDAYALRQNITAQNIANADTPNYRPERVRFEEQFKREQNIHNGNSARSGSATAVAGVQEEAEVPEAEQFFSGESHVNVDREMSEMAQNQIKFRLASRLTNKYFQGLQTAIKGQ